MCEDQDVPSSVTVSGKISHLCFVYDHSRDIILPSTKWVQSCLIFSILLGIGLTNWPRKEPESKSESILNILLIDSLKITFIIWW